MISSRIHRGSWPPAWSFLRCSNEGLPPSLGRLRSDRSDDPDPRPEPPLEPPRDEPDEPEDPRPFGPELFPPPLLPRPLLEPPRPVLRASRPLDGRSSRDPRLRRCPSAMSCILYKQKEGRHVSTLSILMSGGDLLSQGVAPQVPSALTGFTSVFGMGTGGSPSLSPPDKSSSVGQPRALHSEHVSLIFDPSPRAISTGQLNTLLYLHFRPINPIVCGGPYPIMLVGNLILKRASRLDAFSGYHSRT